jgi:hypothetical protein
MSKSSICGYKDMLATKTQKSMYIDSFWSMSLAFDAFSQGVHVHSQDVCDQLDFRICG